MRVTGELPAEVVEDLESRGFKVRQSWLSKGRVMLGLTIALLAWFLAGAQPGERRLRGSGGERGGACEAGGGRLVVFVWAEWEPNFQLE